MSITGRRVRIGVIAHTGLVGATPDGDALQHFVAAVPYIKAVQKTGALAVILPIVDNADIDAALDAVDGVVITGGVDVDPANYGAAPHAELGEISPGRDHVDLALARAVVERNIATLAVCRGIQVVNVALGGTLVQHIDDHMRPDAYNQLVHRVAIDGDSMLADVVGTQDLGVNTLHHQVIDKLGDGVRVAARNSDGHVEAITIAGAPNVLAVQWHPELLRHDPQHLGLFAWLLTRKV